MCQCLSDELFPPLLRRPIVYRFNDYTTGGSTVIESWIQRFWPSRLRRCNNSFVKPSLEFDRFSNLVSHVLSVPKTEILRREAEYEKQAALNPNRRGPKRGSKRKPIPLSTALPLLSWLVLRLLTRQL